MGNLNILTTDEKVVQLTDIVQQVLTRITDLEDELRAKTVAFDPDVANMDDVADVPDADAKKSPKKSPKNVPKKSKNKSPEKSPKKSDEELSLMGFDPAKCRRRKYAGGWGCQCQKSIFENGLCKADYNALYGPDAKETGTASPEKETFSHGYHDDIRPDENLVSGGAHRWRGSDGEFPSKSGAKKAVTAKVAKKPKGPSIAEIRAEIAELEPDMDITGMKKSELIGILEGLKKNQEIPEVVPEVPGVVQEVPQDLEEELGDDLASDDDEALGEYDDIEYQGVEYLTRQGKLFNADFEEIGTWDDVLRVPTFTNATAKEDHEENMDEESDDEA